MSVHPKGYFYQLNDDGSIKEETKVSFSQKFTDQDLTEQQLILYATYELKRHYELYDTLRINKFSLRKPFYIVVSLKKQRYNFICQSIPASYLPKLRPVDFPFRLKQTLFVVLPKAMEIKKGKTQEKPLPPSDLNRLLNAIDAKMQAAYKSFSPVIYTGMTN